MKKCILLVFVLVFCLSNNSIPKENRYESEFTFIIGPDANNQQIKKRLEFYSSYSRIITHVHISEDRLIIKFENFVSPKKVIFLLETTGLAQIKAAPGNIQDLARDRANSALQSAILGNVFGLGNQLLSTFTFKNQNFIIQKIKN